MREGPRRCVSGGACSHRCLVTVNQSLTHITSVAWCSPRAVFLLSWISTRVLAFPLIVIRSTLFESKVCALQPLRRQQPASQPANQPASPLQSSRGSAGPHHLSLSPAHVAPGQPQGGGGRCASLPPCGTIPAPYAHAPATERPSSTTALPLRPPNACVTPHCHWAPPPRCRRGQMS